MEELAVAAGADLVDGRRVKVDEEGPGHIFAAAGLGEEGVVGTRVADIRSVGVGAAIMAKAVLKKIAGGNESAASWYQCGWGVNLQLPGTVTQLGTSLTQVEVKDL